MLKRDYAAMLLIVHNAQKSIIKFIYIVSIISFRINALIAKKVFLLLRINSVEVAIQNVKRALLLILLIAYLAIMLA